MGYHGVLSKGCQRCRQRKVKCDQTKPSCKRCEKHGSPCPGYRDLTTAQFVDESSRVLRKAGVQLYAPQPEQNSHSSKAKSDLKLTYTQVDKTVVYRDKSVIELVGEGFGLFPNSETGLLHPMLGTPINVLAVNFCLAHYAPSGAVASDESYTWLFNAYWDESSDLVRLATDAVSMAAISNRYLAPDLASRSKQFYGQTLVRLNNLLQDPVECLTDSTLMAVVLLGLYERVNIKTWTEYRRWSAHMRGATTLLDLRGREQFDRPAGQQMYVHLRSQIIHNCMVGHTAIPSSLGSTGNLFRPSDSSMATYDTRPGSLARISFQIVNLRADIHSSRMTHSKEIVNTVLAIENELDAWTAHAPTNWVESMPETIEEDWMSMSNTNLFDLTKPEYKYTSINETQIWNNWRVLRIMAHQMLLHNGLGHLHTDLPQGTFQDQYARQEQTSVDIITQTSIDVLRSAPLIAKTPRAGSLVWPLFVIAQEPLNTRHVRSDAIRVLRNINDRLGYRIAALMADTAEEAFENDVGDFPVSQTSLQALLLNL